MIERERAREEVERAEAQGGEVREKKKMRKEGGRENMCKEGGREKMHKELHSPILL